MENGWMENGLSGCGEWRGSGSHNSSKLSDALGNSSTRRKRFIALSGRLRYTSSDKDNTTKF